MFPRNSTVGLLLCRYPPYMSHIKYPPYMSHFNQNCGETKTILVYSLSPELPAFIFGVASWTASSRDTTRVKLTTVVLCVNHDRLYVTTASKKRAIGRMKGSSRSGSLTQARWSVKLGCVVCLYVMSNMCVCLLHRPVCTKLEL